MNNDHRIIEPNKAKIQFEPKPGPWAHPISIALPTDAGMVIGVSGGLSKHQQLAGMILSGCAADVLGASDVALRGSRAEQLVEVALQMADMVLGATIIQQPPENAD